MLISFRFGRLSACLCVLIYSSCFLFGQRSFFDRFDNIETWPNVAVGTDPLGGVVMANDLASSAEEELKHGFYTTSYDSCATLRWTRAYHIDEFALFFNDIAVDGAGEIWIAGQTGRRDLFVLKLDSGGEPIWMRTYNASVYDQCFSLSLNDNAAYLYGSYQDQGLTRSLLLKLDDTGDLVWARGNMNLIGNGTAAAGRDQIYCRADDYLFSLDEDGNTLWARQIQGLDNLDAFYSDPIPTDDGFGMAWYEAARGGQHLNTFDANGNEMNSSVLLTEYEVPLGIAYRSGRFYATAAMPPLDGDTEEGLVLYELDGNLQMTEAQSFVPWPGNRPVRLDIAMHDLGNPVLVGSVRNLGPHTDFVAQFSEDDADQLCVAQVFEAELTTDYRPNLSTANLTTRTPMVEVTDTLLPFALDRFANDIRECGWETGFANLSLDSSILCRDTLQYKPDIQNATFLWWDGNTQGDRILQAPGQYQLTATTCRTDFDIQIDLRLGFCPCSFFIPNAFSPNGDDINDIWLPYADCPYRNIQIQVFNRWGSPVFSGTDIDRGWDGFVQGQRAPSGTYIYILSYEFEIQPGLWHPQSDRGTLNLVR